MAKSLTKSQIIAKLAECSELKKKQVACVLEGIGCLIKDAVGKKGPGVFAVPGLMKITVVQKPAVPRPTRASTRSPSRSRCSRPSPPARSSRSGP